jgi:MoaA/NifB/PqqE/SkfB family radical SAM enzyme
MDRPMIDVWYITDLTLCNFDCSYCASGIPEQGGERSRTRMWARDDSLERFHRALDWIAAQPYQIGLRLQTHGEPFVSKDFLAGAARMTQAPNVSFVELVSNGSLITRRLDDLLEVDGVEQDKLSLWITHHHTEITVEKLFENALHAHHRGVSVVLNTLLFPGNAPDAERLQELCTAHGIQINIDVGQNINEAYGDAFFLPMLSTDDSRRYFDLVANKAMLLAALVAHRSPRNFGCSAGCDYIYITPDGDVYPCRNYSFKQKASMLGSVHDPDFRLQLRPEPHLPCEASSNCVCKEDYLHLAPIRSQRPAAPRSLGLWPAHEATMQPELVDRLREIERDYGDDEPGKATMSRLLDWFTAQQD